MQPFYRSRQIMGLIIEIIQSQTIPNSMKRAALSQVPVYRSRGHGKGGYVDRPMQVRSKYVPHQGPRECARRLKQAYYLRSASKTLRKVWQKAEHDHS